MKTLIALITLLAVRLFAEPVTNGVPNLDLVEAGVYRGGLPNQEGWKFLTEHGVTNVVMLSGQKHGQKILGIVIHHVPIPKEDRVAIVQESKLIEAVSMIHPGTFICCEDGRSQTGLIIAAYRVLKEQWPWKQAQQEMISHGFSKGNHGMWEAWNRLIVDHGIRKPGAP